MSDQQQSVWPDGAREAVMDAKVAHELRPYREEVDAILTALEPFVQQRIAEATKTLGLQLHEAETRNGITGGVYTELYALRAEVARLREDGEEASDRERRLNVMLSRTRAELSAICLAVIQEMTAAIGRGEPYTYQSASLNGGVIHSTRGDLNDLKRSLELAIDAAWSARGGEG